MNKNTWPLSPDSIRVAKAIAMLVYERYRAVGFPDDYFWNKRAWVQVMSDVDTRTVDELYFGLDNGNQMTFRALIYAMHNSGKGMRELKSWVEGLGQ